MKNLFMLSTLLMVSSNLFAMGNTDYSKVQATLDALTKKGVSCNLYKAFDEKISGSDYTYEVECTDKNKKIARYVIVSKITNPGSRCADETVISIKLKPAPKVNPKGGR